MTNEVEYTTRFQRSIKQKWKRNPDLAQRVEETVVRILFAPESNSLNVHRIRGADNVWEAYVDNANRVTFERDGDTIIFRNNCNHDIIDRRQW